MQDQKMSSLRAETGGVLRDARVVRHKVLGRFPFLFHNAHLQSGKEPPKNCGICKGGLASVVKVVEQRIPAGNVGKSVGTDEETSTPPTPRAKFWPWDSEES